MVIADWLIKQQECLGAFKFKAGATISKFSNSSVEREMMMQYPAHKFFYHQ